MTASTSKVAPLPLDEAYAPSVPRCLQPVWSCLEVSTCRARWCSLAPADDDVCRARRKRAQRNNMGALDGTGSFRSCYV